MAKFMSHDHLYNKLPLSSDQNRDEHFLIEVPGNWIPECDIILYGLLNSELSEEFYKIKYRTRFDPHEIYLDLAFFESSDLLKYLASNDENLVDLSEDDMIKATAAAIDNYTYIPSNETMLRHAIIEASYFDFMQSITLLYPWPIREIDRIYLTAIIPEAVIEKLNLVYSPSLKDFLESEEAKSLNYHYTTIILNSLEELNELIDNPKKYRVEDTFFLLRNHSKNMSMIKTEDPDNPGKELISFEEIGTFEVLQKLIDFEKAIPKSQMRFARYEPILFQDAKPDPKEFQLGR